MSEHSFTKTERLLRPGDFVRVLKSGRKTHTKSFRVAVLPNGLGKNRLGVSVSAKVAGSVHRSRIKRLIKEFFRLNKTRIGANGVKGGSWGAGGAMGVKVSGARDGQKGGRGQRHDEAGAAGRPGVAGAPAPTGPLGDEAATGTLDIVVTVKRVDLVRGLKDVERELAPVLCWDG